jgi:hypothetical protein
LQTIDWKMRGSSDGSPREGAPVRLGLEEEAAPALVSGFTGELVRHPIPLRGAEKADRNGLPVIKLDSMSS